MIINRIRVLERFFFQGELVVL